MAGGEAVKGLSYAQPLVTAGARVLVDDYRTWSWKPMAEMIRKQVYIEPRQEQLLKALARELGVTEAELIRHGIDRGLAGLAESRPDPAAWKEVERYILRRMRKGPVRGKRGWTREELYGR